MAITKKNDAEGSAFWKPAENAHIKVESWPSWKRDLKVTQRSVECDSRPSGASKIISKSVCKKEG